jgi:heterodisulfide reductase subunit C
LRCRPSSKAGGRREAGRQQMATANIGQVVMPAASFRREIESRSGQKVSACFQCEKCSNGCPVTFAMDIAPHRLIRSVQLGLKDEVLASDTIWLCASCETCTTRCPNGIDIAHIMDSLRQMSAARGVKASQRQVPLFHSAFLSSISTFGRVHEMTMTVSFALRSGGVSGLLKQANIGLQMLRKGKIRIIPARLWAGSQVKNMFKRAGEQKA